ncbi:uncharacterized protein EV422DRAFT_540123 [Fimicolochytrium jonesii]|uniref:uncharacterized protein n=1 Tax=Fimicolochytrium jonesii TaxID=1396493 RepID=UPI0022FE61FE|nr:uncharacterized protein EV422DRAFT_540123 [Fimicolochytrium jonesii]KAI8817827.1 hypothetical protein EV422DRAFT_540123 [Fimicolochytrium jonesii]
MISILSRLYTFLLLLALLTLLHAPPTSSAPSLTIRRITRRQSSGSGSATVSGHRTDDNSPPTSTKCTIGADPSIKKPTYGNCTTAHKSQLADCDSSDSSCTDAATQRLENCGLLCTTTDEAVTKCAKQCEKIWERFEKYVCKPILGSKDGGKGPHGACQNSNWEQLGACQDICVKFHAGLGNVTGSAGSGSGNGSG